MFPLIINQFWKNTRLLSFITRSPMQYLFTKPICWSWSVDVNFDSSIDHADFVFFLMNNHNKLLRLRLINVIYYRNRRWKYGSLSLLTLMINSEFNPRINKLKKQPAILISRTAWPRKSLWFNGRLWRAHVNVEYDLFTVDKKKNICLNTYF